MDAEGWVAVITAVFAGLNTLLLTWLHRSVKSGSDAFKASVRYKK